jgi:hypothetical protein
MLYLISFICTFFAIALRGFQHKNVIGGHTKLVCLTAYIMYVFDVLAVSLIVRNDLSIVFVSAFGSSLGMYVAIRLHDRVLGKPE